MIDAEILAAVAAEEAAMAALLVELVRGPTVLGDEAAGQAIMRPRLPGSASSRSTSRSIPRRRRATRAPRRSAGTSPASRASSRAGSRRRDATTWLYGRGASDMKSGLAAMVGAVRALQRLGLEPCGRVQLQSVVEEECTGKGALACVLAGHTADAAILTEPTRGAVSNAPGGCALVPGTSRRSPGPRRRRRERDRGIGRRDRCASLRPS